MRDLDPLPDRPDRSRVRAVADVLEVRGLVGERVVERRGVAQQDAAHGLRQVEPLVRVDRERVDALEPAEQGSARRRGRRGGAVGAVDVHPDVVLGADVGEGVERIDGARAGRARDADDGDGRHAGRDVRLDRAGELVGPDAEGVVAADLAKRAPAQAEHVAGAADRVVGLLGGVDRGRTGLDAQLARGRQGPGPGAGQAREVGERPAAREVADPGRESDQLREPAPRHVLHLGGRARAPSEVGVERAPRAWRRRPPPRATSRR